MAVCADAVLIPEIPYDLRKVAARLRKKLQARSSALVVVAEGAAAERPIGSDRLAVHPLKASLSPGATGRKDRT